MDCPNEPNGASPERLQEDVAVIDARGLRCPEPVMLLHAAMRKAPPGAVLKLLATDPSTERDVANFCRFLDHELAATDHTSDQFCYLIKKAL